MIATAQQKKAFALPVLQSSVARKLAVSVTGLFLILFLAVHLAVNLTMLAGAETYNAAAHWMGTTPAILALRPVLALGLLLHVVISLLLALDNSRARPTGYEKVDPAGGSTWAARHPAVLGVLILLFLGLHLSSFSLRMTFGSPPMVEVAGVMMKDAYQLVTARFGLWWYVALYAAAMLFLGLHLAHGFRSAFQTLGLSDRRWRRRWTVLGYLYSVAVAVGFAALPLYFFVTSQAMGAP